MILLLINKSFPVVITEKCVCVCFVFACLVYLTPCKGNPVKWLSPSRWHHKHTIAIEQAIVISKSLSLYVAFPR